MLSIFLSHYPAGNEQGYLIELETKYNHPVDVLIVA